MRAALLVLVLLTAPLGAPAFAAGATGFSLAGQQPESQPPKVDEFVPVSQLPPQDQLPAAPLLVGAYAFVWLALFGYVVSLGRRLSKVQGEVARLESDIAKGTRA